MDKDDAMQGSKTIIKIIEDTEEQQLNGRVNCSERIKIVEDLGEEEDNQSVELEKGYDLQYN